MEGNQMGNGEGDQWVGEDASPILSCRACIAAMLWLIGTVPYFADFVFQNGLQELCHINLSRDTIIVMCVMLACFYAHWYYAHHVSLGRIWRQIALMGEFLQFLCAVVLPAIPACKNYSLCGEDSRKFNNFIQFMLVRAAFLWLYTDAAFILGDGHHR
ncbi:uncharacterized protein LOC131161439 [Malania oleifera]|uniref:uncharacterized protein LOC131161439 n=1 Tax=Malania oleifera TaxID=397392 RepID=UPI0025AE9AA7|nr:uncharacterized protein LOC131161439 [Malania oleifera]